MMKSDKATADNARVSPSLSAVDEEIKRVSTLSKKSKAEFTEEDWENWIRLVDKLNIPAKENWMLYIKFREKKARQDLLKELTDAGSPDSLCLGVMKTPIGKFPIALLRKDIERVETELLKDGEKLLNVGDAYPEIYGSLKDKLVEIWHGEELKEEKVNKNEK